MSIPLIQKPEKDDINTSIIAIKRNIERINMLLGLVDSGSDPDLSGLATKQELQDAITELTPVDEVTVDNMQSVTSNAVASSLSYSTTEVKTGAYWIDGKPIYRKVVDCGALPNATGKTVAHSISNLANVVNLYGISQEGIRSGSINTLPYVNTGSISQQVRLTVTQTDIVIETAANRSSYVINYVIIEYTKTTD